MLVTLLLAVAIARSAGDSFHQHAGMENGGVFLVPPLFLLELELVPMLLAPFDQRTLEVLLLLGNLFDNDVFLKDLLFHEAIAIPIASVEVDGTHKCLEGIAAHETVMSRRDSPRMTDELVQPQVVRKPVERTSAHNLAAQGGEKSLLLVTIVLVENVGDNGTQHGVAQELKTLIVNVMMVLLFMVCLRLVHQRQFVQPDVPRIETHNGLKPQKRLLLTNEKKPHFIYNIRNHLNLKESSWNGSKITDIS